MRIISQDYLKTRNTLVSPTTCSKMFGMGLTTRFQILQVQYIKFFIPEESNDKTPFSS